MKRYVIGDIHGCHDELCNLIAQILIHCKGEDFKLIFVGDYVDRGPKSKEVVDLVRRLERQGHVALMGNHEDMILAGEYMYATQTLVSFNASIHGGLPEDVTEWMRRLPKYYEDDTIIVAHAAAKPGVPMNEQADAFLMWYRYQGGQKADLGKHFYHGHTPTLGKIEQVEDRTNVDTACVYGGHLTAAIVGDDGKPEGFIQVPHKDSPYA
mgnify:CR=1 FL=1